MGEDVLHVWRACESVRVVHLSESATGVRREVQRIIRHSRYDGQPGPDVRAVPGRETGDDDEWRPHTDRVGYRRIGSQNLAFGR